MAATGGNREHIRQLWRDVSLIGRAPGDHWTITAQSNIVLRTGGNFNGVGQLERQIILLGIIQTPRDDRHQGQQGLIA